MHVITSTEPGLKLCSLSVRAQDHSPKQEVLPDGPRELQGGYEGGACIENAPGFVCAMEGAMMAFLALPAELLLAWRVYFLPQHILKA